MLHKGRFWWRWHRRNPIPLFCTLPLFGLVLSKSLTVSLTQPFAARGLCRGKGMKIPSFPPPGYNRPVFCMLHQQGCRGDRIGLYFSISFARLDSLLMTLQNTNPDLCRSVFPSHQRLRHFSAFISCTTCSVLPCGRGTAAFPPPQPEAACAFFALLYALSASPCIED